MLRLAICRELSLERERRWCSAPCVASRGRTADSFFGEQGDDVHADSGSRAVLMVRGLQLFDIVVQLVGLLYAATTARLQKSACNHLRTGSERQVAVRTLGLCDWAWMLESWWIGSLRIRVAERRPRLVIVATSYRLAFEREALLASVGLPLSSTWRSAVYTPLLTHRR